MTFTHRPTDYRHPLPPSQPFQVIRFSAVLVNSVAKMFKISLGCRPEHGVAGSGPAPPLLPCDATESARAAHYNDGDCDDVHDLSMNYRYVRVRCCYSEFGDGQKEKSGVVC